MKKKILLGIAVALGAVATLPMFSAFEAHVINVTARIENALAVTPQHINFGTVFPQEHLDKPLGIALSDSFLREPRVDDVNYIIRQKPKCGVTNLEGTELVEGSTATGHVIIEDDPNTPDVVEYRIDCGTDPNEDDNPGNSYNPSTHRYGVLPSLCEYISKEPDMLPRNDETMPSFHRPWWIATTTDPAHVRWNDVHGRLAKSQTDYEDIWTIDLAVPCFGGYCAQDWAEFVGRINPHADPRDYTQPIINEHKIFGCDLWVEVTGVSETPPPPTVPPTGELTVNKVTIGFEDPAIGPEDFELRVDGDPVGNGSSNTLPIGTHTVTEVAIGDAATLVEGVHYSATFTGDCDGSNEVDVAEGDTDECTITNTSF